MLPSPILRMLNALVGAEKHAAQNFSRRTGACSSVSRCPTPTPKAASPNLSLGPNEIYRKAILEAAHRTGIDPAAIASVINAEAVKNRDGVWDPESQAATSSAKGLTQFLKGTWLEMARTPGTLLNETCRKNGLLDDRNQVIEGRAEDVLDLRSDPRLSIVTGAEYAKSNLDYLDSKNLIPTDATDDDKARLAYIAHHEGPGGARQFLQNSLSEERSQKLLTTQIGQKKADRLVEQEGTAKAAYQRWLNGYTDKKIQPDRFREDSRASASPVSTAPSSAVPVPSIRPLFP